MTRDQKIVALGEAAGIVALLLTMWLAYDLLPAPSGVAEVGERVAYALQWNAFAALPLLVMIGAVGAGRLLGGAIDPTRGAESRRLMIDARVVDNTTQQFVLFWAGSLGLAAGIDAAHVKAIGAAAIVFVVARIAFWVGYRIDPLYRAFGYAMTVWLNTGLIGGAIWFLVAG
jgi:hypothetical protein